MTETESGWAAVFCVVLLLAPVVIYVVGRIRRK
jgi:hypothetical protein